MNIKALRESFMILTLPLLVYGQVSINPSGSVTDGESYTLACTITSFTGTATWTKDGSSLTICTATFCTVPDIDDYKFSSNASGIQVVMYPVSSSIDGLWECAASGNIQQINVTSTRSVTSTTTTQSNTTIKPTQSWCSNRCTWLIPTLVVGVVVILICLIGLCCYKKRSKDRGRRHDNDENVNFSSKTAEKTEKSAHKFKMDTNVTGTSVDNKYNEQL